MSSKERILRTIDGEGSDYGPLCLFLFSELRRRSADGFDFCRRQMELGTDPIVELPALPMRFHDEVRVEVRREPARPNPLLRKVYRTPGGDLEAIVEKTADWPHRDEIPLMSDFVIPRARKFPVAGRGDLEALGYLLREPGAEAIAAFREEAARVRAFADAHGLAVRGGFHRLSDTICWLAGCERFATLGRSDPGFFEALIDLVARWQERHIEIILEARPDIVVDAQWYATTFLSPRLYERFLSPALMRRVEMVHAGGARFATVATTNVMPFFDLLKGLGIDMLFGVDPIQGRWDLGRTKAELGDRVCLCGGINGYLTVVDGSPEDVERAVEEAMAALAPGGRFILAPVDDVRIDHADAEARWPGVWRNVDRMVAAWRRLR